MQFPNFPCEMSENVLGHVYLNFKIWIEDLQQILDQVIMPYKKNVKIVHPQISAPYINNRTIMLSGNINHKPDIQMFTNWIPDIDVVDG